MPDKTLSDVFSDIASAIREKAGNEQIMTPLEMADNIAAIPAGPEDPGLYFVNSENELEDLSVDASSAYTVSFGEDFATASVAAMDEYHAYHLNDDGDVVGEDFWIGSWQSPILYWDSGSGYYKNLLNQGHAGSILMSRDGSNQDSVDGPWTAEVGLYEVYDEDGQGYLRIHDIEVDINPTYASSVKQEIIYCTDAEEHYWDKKEVLDSHDRSLTEIFHDGSLIYSSGTNAYVMSSGFYYINDLGQPDFPGLDLVTGHAYTAATNTLTAMSDGTYTISDGIPSAYVPPTPTYNAGVYVVDANNTMTAVDDLDAGLFPLDQTKTYTLSWDATNGWCIVEGSGGGTDALDALMQETF